MRGNGKQKKRGQPHIRQPNRASVNRRGKDAHLSLSFGEAGSEALRQVSWLRLQPTRRAFQPLDTTRDSGFLRLSWPSQWRGPRRNYTGLPYEALEQCDKAIITTTKNICQDFFTTSAGG